MGLFTLAGQVVEPGERVIAQLDLVDILEVEGLLVSVQVDELDASCTCSQLDEKWPCTVLCQCHLVQVNILTATK